MTAGDLETWYDEVPGVEGLAGPRLTARERIDAPAQVLPPGYLTCQTVVGFHSDKVPRAATLPMHRLLTRLAAMAMGAAIAHSVAAAAPAGPAACSWDRPGHDSFMGDVPAAVDRYTDIAPAVRERLKARMRAHEYDDVVEISRDRIVGRANYEPGIRGMHFGEGRVCGTVSRAGWSEGQRERALVYCEGSACVMVPTVCRNVSRIERAPGSGGAKPPGDEELVFDPPGAGVPAPVPGDSPAPLSTLPPSPLTGVPATPPGSFVSPPRVSIGPPPTGSPPTAIPPPPLFVLPPAVTELPPTVAPPLAVPPVVPVPEPSTSAMVIAGLGLLIASLRRSCRARSRCRAPRGVDERVGLRKMPTAHDVLSRPIRC